MQWIQSKIHFAELGWNSKPNAAERRCNIHFLLKFVSSQGDYLVYEQWFGYSSGYTLGVMKMF